MSVAADPQIGLYEVTIDNPDIEAALEKRDSAKGKAKVAGKAYRDADVVAKEQLNTLDLGDDAPVRIGRFVVTRKKTAAKSVSFETAPGVRIAIKTLTDE